MTSLERAAGAVPNAGGHSTRNRQHNSDRVAPRPPRRPRAAACLSTMLAALFMITACSSADRAQPGETGTVPPGLAGPSAPAEGELTFSIDEYVPTVAERAQLGQARTLLIGKCLRRFGFAFDSAAATAKAERALDNDVKDLGLRGNKRRYGVLTEQAATRYGYHLESTVDGTADKLAKGGADPHGFGQLTPAMQAVLTGKTAEGQRPPPVNGVEVPEGGCEGEANAKLAEAGGPPSFNLPVLVSKIRADSFTASLTDPGVTAAFAAWSACMRAKGYDYPMPLEVARDFDVENTPAVSPAETATALADVTCKKETKLVDVWFGFESRYQQAQIERNAEELKRIKEENAARMKVVVDVVSAG
jgi:hypothetical protein